MLATIIAVLGTLCGAALTGFLQHVITSADRREGRADTARQAQLSAVTALVSALADHRRAMWVRKDLRLTGASPADLAAARAESHATHSAVTAPLAAVAILAPALADSARRAADATYALRNTPYPGSLTERRQGAIGASDELLKAASDLLGATS